jgi:hypothetical protein
MQVHQYLMIVRGIELNHVYTSRCNKDVAIDNGIVTVKELSSRSGWSSQSDPIISKLELELLHYNLAMHVVVDAN